MDLRLIRNKKMPVKEFLAGHLLLLCTLRGLFFQKEIRQRIQNIFMLIAVNDQLQSRIRTDCHDTKNGLCVNNNTSFAQIHVVIKLGYRSDKCGNFIDVVDSDRVLFHIASPHKNNTGYIYLLFCPDYMTKCDIKICLNLYKNRLFLQIFEDWCYNDLGEGHVKLLFGGEYEERTSETFKRFIACNFNFAAL
jgi:hypothetical protein